MKNRTVLLGKALVLSVVLVLLLCGYSNAYIIAYNSDSGLTADDFSGSVSIMVYNNSQLWVTLTNTTTATPNSFPSDVALTGWGFVLPEGVTITEGGFLSVDQVSDPFTVSIKGTTYSGTETVINKTWGYDQTKVFNTALSGSIYDGVFNAAISTLIANVDTVFDPSTGSFGVDGPPHGILDSSYYDSKSPYIYGFATFYLTFSEDTELNDLAASIMENPQLLVFGSPNTVPEPATMLLLGFGLIGLAAFGRKSFLKGA